MLQRVLTISLILATAIAGDVAAARAADLDPPTVKGNVSMQFPKGWTAAAGRALMGAVAPQQDKDATGQYPASLSVTQAAGAKIDAAAQQQALQQRMQGYKVMDPPTPVQVGGMQGVAFGGSFKSNNMDLRTRLYMFSVNNQIYTITFTCLNSTWQKYQADLQASVQTFAVKKPTTGP